MTTHLPLTEWYHYVAIGLPTLDCIPFMGAWENVFPYSYTTQYYRAHFINPDWVALDESRGNESKNLIHFMRLTSLATDVLIFFSAAYAFTRAFKKPVL